jgi:PAS domain S-box-containing protein
MLLLAAVYFGAGYAGQRLLIFPGNLNAVWAPAGIALAAALLWGWRAWPGIALGSLLINSWATFSFAGLSTSTTALGAMALVAAGSTVEPLLGAYLVNRLTGRRNPLERAADVFALAAACVAGCLVGAAIGTSSVAAGGLIGWGNYAYIWWTWWLGDISGALIVAPIVLVWRAPPPWLVDRQLRVEVVGGLLLLLGVDWLIFSDWPLDPAIVRPLPYLVLPLLVWAALRFGLHGATLAIGVTTAFALWGTLGDRGAFAGEALNASLQALQVFVGVVALTTLALAAALAERRQAVTALQAARSELERRVAERTAALERSEARFRAAAEGSLDAFLILDSLRDRSGLIVDFQFVDLNEHAAQRIGLPKDAIIGQRLCELLPVNRTDGFFEKYVRVVDTGEPLEEEFTLGQAEDPDIWLHHQVVPLDDGIAITSRNISARKRAEAALRASEEATRRFLGRLKALHEVTLELSRVDSVDQLCYRAIELGRDRLEFDRLGIWLLDDDPNFIVGSFGIDELGQIRDERNIRLPIDDDRLVRDVFESELPVSVNLDTTLLDDRYGPVGQGWNAIAALQDRGRVIGYISVDNLLRRQPIEPYQIEILALYGATLGLLCVRKRAEAALRASEETTRHFLESLKALHEVGLELSRIDSFDDLCRRAIELGRDRLEFDRLGIWLLDDDPGFIVGAFGTDEHGRIRDERGSRQPANPTDLVTAVLIDKLPVGLHHDVDLHNHRNEVVGRGWFAVAGLWDRDRAIGYISADNLLRGQPISSYQLDILALYGSTLGHLCVHKRADDAIRQLNAQLELRVAERTKQLEATNKELEAFSYSVSHDLRAPLRQIDSFARLIRTRAAGQLDATSERHLHVIGVAIGRMNQLIDDLLALSRASRAEMRTGRVALGPLVEDVRRELAPALEQRQIVWDIGALPTVEADSALLRIALVNLLGNAIKYTAPRPQAHIAVRATPGDGGEQIIAISDDGVGFDMQYADQLFGVFRRLHRDDEFEGAGIGLATVRRVIHRHGGRVWAEGQPDHGATFYFTMKGASNGGGPQDDPAGGG